MDMEGVLLRFDELFRGLQEEVDEDRGTVEAVNTLMVVAAFIAGVQAQIISFTLVLPKTIIPKAANIFAFTGLMLEISGTFLGAIHSVFLQRKVKASSKALNAMEQCKADLKIVLKFYEQALRDESEMERERREEERQQQQYRREQEEWDRMQRESQDRRTRNQMDIIDSEEEEDANRHQMEQGTAPDSAEGPGAPQVPIIAQPPSPQRQRRRKQPVTNVRGLCNYSDNATISNCTITFIDDNRRAVAADFEDQAERLARIVEFIAGSKRLGWTIRQAKIIGAIEAIIKEVEKRIQTARVDPESGHVDRPKDSEDATQEEVPVPEIVKVLFTFGSVPLVSMACGVVCLALSTILLSAGSTQLGAEVWTCSLGVLILVMTLSGFPHIPVARIMGQFKSRTTARKQRPRVNLLVRSLCLDAPSPPSEDIRSGGMFPAIAS